MIVKGKYIISQASNDLIYQLNLSRNKIISMSIDSNPSTKKLQEMIKGMHYHARNQYGNKGLRGLLF